MFVYLPERAIPFLFSAIARHGASNFNGSATSRKSTSIGGLSCCLHSLPMLKKIESV